ncbi:MAG: hypothetical protein BMS9Abin01_2578 [Gammaproteobacteria bacterium]|nr:MAG: hypothetical protein BMS9Abin01_2578 [Gammaproteobacteria bacterium]
MSMPYSCASIHALTKVLAIALLAVTLAGCGTNASKGAAQGAGTGAIAGAVGGAVTALVFGGNPVEAATRSAVWGASAGATTGAIAGSQVDKKADQQKEAEFAKLREGTTALGNIREEYGRPRVCAA